MLYLPHLLQGSGPVTQGLRVANTCFFLWVWKQESLETKITMAQATTDTETPSALQHKCPLRHQASTQASYHLHFLPHL